MNNISEITRPKISIEDYLNSFVGNARPTRGTIHNWCQTGVLPAIKIGKRWFIYTDEPVREEGHDKTVEHYVSKIMGD
jgi:hypothetical protein